MTEEAQQYEKGVKKEKSSKVKTIKTQMVGIMVHKPTK